MATSIGKLLTCSSANPYPNQKFELFAKKYTYPHFRPKKYFKNNPMLSLLEHPLLSVVTSMVNFTILWNFLKLE